MFRSILFCAGLMGGAPALALANSALGTWMTEPDRKGQVAHVEARQCGDALCGQIVRTYDKTGNRVSTPNLGKQLFWDMKQVSPGVYQGTGWLPLQNATFQGNMKVKGDRMVVQGCIAFVCQSQTWRRVRVSS
ncbi:hypothetical protein TG4357_02613 [Thalassovita gelatinovora]|uniref:DUF2147 domain-containing protein n=1 Tax=Thalassovita gelatinovora TaxID=53501 RepID=A0A0P1G0E4_THAGE|nr:DUF2147 domain-containing protein [Thalassovita gelatinovora]QIZ79742.1 DUF2147 domain-containing protein [Thalassovita gelatinovora]CUH66744.1 hypothetical protein TG4357_02613 [Thalassovita gelatinovora]SEQ42012.1 Uncharacterized conserved protein, DUF2147 family [Thalassovita gelatinovora]